MELDAGGDSGKRMRVDRHLPEQLAVGRIHRVNISADIAEECRVLRGVGLHRTDYDRAAKSGLSLEAPVCAARRGIQGIDKTGVGT